MMKRLFALCLSAVLLLAACGEDNVPTRPNDFVPLTAITVESQYPRIAAGTSNQFRATGDFSGKFTRDITAEVTWESGAPAVLKFSNPSIPGLGKGQAVDTNTTTTVTATSGSVIGTLDFTVTNATASQVAVTPATVSLPVGMTQQFTATGTFDDPLVPTQDITRDVAWSSADDTIATVNATGLATAVEAGDVEITAEFNGLTSNAAQITVTLPELQSITVTPASPVLTIGQTQPFTATGKFTDGTSRNITDQVTWESSDTTVATIDSTGGLATAVSTGTTTIKARFNGKEGTTELTVATITAIQITPENPQVSVGSTQELTATATLEGGRTRDITDNVSWETSGTGFVEVDSKGRVTGQAVGSENVTAKITTQTGTVVQDSVTVFVVR